MYIVRPDFFLYIDPGPVPVCSKFSNATGGPEECAPSVRQISSLGSGGGVKSLIDSDVNKKSSWWNEILVYDTKIIDMFVMQRVLDNSVLAKVEIEKLLSTASGNKPITIGAPAQFRKWFKERKGKIHKG